jgi:hypothetical protein
MELMILPSRRIGVSYAATCGGGGGRLTEAQKPLKKKSCLSTERWNFDFGF